MKIKLYNTLTRKKEAFTSLKDRSVRFYACGLTVYDYGHIGNLRTYIFEDVLRRVLEYNGYEVKHVMNITDVGHLTSQGDEGEDKMIKALRREGKEITPEAMLEVARFYTSAFKRDMRMLNIKEPDVWCKATEHIEEQISMIEEIVSNGYAYETETALYFDTHKLDGYTKLAGQSLESLEREASENRRDKKNPVDFALWLKTVGEHENHVMNWDSPWGKGFPGWHIECSAMSTEYLGETFDIHCGGVDHIKVHHTNERAQNIATFRHPVVKRWMHGEFLVLKDEKMSKSKGNFYTLEDLIEKEFDPLAYRYLSLGAHYRSPLSFSFEALEGAANSLEKLKERIREMKKSKEGEINERYRERFKEKISDDLGTPEALALTWKMVKDDKLDPADKLATLLDFDRVLGLGLREVQEIRIPSEIEEMVKEREALREKKKFEEADLIRKKVKKMGYGIEDTEKGPKIKRE